MVSCFKTILPIIALVVTGCHVFDDDPDDPHFIFRCVDAGGCGHSDEDDIYGHGDIFGPVLLTSRFELYYGEVNSSGWSDGGAINEYDINTEDGVEIISASEERLDSGPPFYARSTGLTAVIAMKDDKVIDYLYIEVEAGGDVPDDPNDHDTENDSDNTGDTDSGIDVSPGDTGSDNDTDTRRDSDSTTDTPVPTDSATDTAPVIDTDGSDAGMTTGLDSDGEPDGGMDGGQSDSDRDTDLTTDPDVIPDSESDTAIIPDTDDMDGGVDAGPDSAGSQDGGTDSGMATRFPIRTIPLPTAGPSVAVSNVKGGRA